MHAPACPWYVSTLVNLKWARGGHPHHISNEYDLFFIFIKYMIITGTYFPTSLLKERTKKRQAKMDKQKKPKNLGL